MKLLLGVLFLGHMAFADTINMSDGETITITANQTTTVICGEGGSGGSCTDAANSLKGELDSCSNGSSSPGAAWCVGNIWPNWKYNNSKCISQGSAACVESCSDSTTTPGSAWCVDNCQ